MRRLTYGLFIVLGAALLLAACTSASHPSTSTTAKAATRLPITTKVRHGLLDAAAAYHQLPVSDFTGLLANQTYYAFDSRTNVYYAAAGLVANPHSLQAEIGDQDDGAYNLFTRASGGGSWTVYNDGLGGAQDSTCPISIPSDVLAVWHWKVGGCYPPASE
jgi:predicted lipoprotein with Yx(FWY)xxD motif